MMIPHQLSTIKLPRILRICIYAGLLCSFFGGATDTRAQTVCEALDLSALDCTYLTGFTTVLPSGLELPPLRRAGDRVRAFDYSSNTYTPWRLSSMFHRSQDGEDSRRSGALVGGRQSSCMVLAVNALPVGSQVSFSLRTSSEGGRDRLMFAVDNRIEIEHFSAPVGSTTRGWERFRFTFPNNPRNLTWCYIKNEQTARGDDSGWVDWLDFDLLHKAVSSDLVCSALDVSAENCPLISVETTLPSGLVLPREGCCDSHHASTRWVESPEATEGDTSLRSGDINDEQGNCLILKAILPANTRINFSLRIRAQGQHDRMAFFTDSDTVIRNFSAPLGSNTKDWLPQKEVVLANNVSNLTWCYLKNVSASASNDSGWIDDLSFTIPPPMTVDQACAALDMSTEDCALVSSVSSIPPAGLTLPNSPFLGDTSLLTATPWSVSGRFATQGDSSLQTADIDHLQASCLVLGVTLPVGTRISFSLRTDTEGFEDRLFFAADDQILIGNFSADRGSVLRSWESLESLLPISASKLTWCYLKNSVSDGGSDTGWIDNLSFITSQICQELDMSLQECSLIASISYDPPDSPWVISSTATNGDTSLRSGDIDGAGQSCLVLNVSLPSRTLVQFSRRVSSHMQNRLNFSVDGIFHRYDLRAQPETILRDWSREVHILFDLQGQQALSWCYDKVLNSVEGEGRAWIDDLSLIVPPAAPLNREVVCLVLDMSFDDCERITGFASVPENPSWYISYFADQGRTALRSDPDVDDDQTSCLVLEGTLPANTRISFALRTDSEGGSDFAYFEADGVRLIENFSAPPGSSLRNFEPLEISITNPVSNLRWCYQKDSRISVGDDSIWLDNLSFSPAAEGLSVQDVCLALVRHSGAECAQITGVITGVSFDPPQSPWVISSIVLEDGTTEDPTSLRSGDIDANQQSCLALGVSIMANHVIRFSLRSDSAGMNNFLNFRVTGPSGSQDFPLLARTGFMEWEQQVLHFSDRITAMRWCYTKNNDSGSQAVWLDTMSFTSQENVQLSEELVCQALDMSADDCALIKSVSTTLPTDLTLPAISGASILREDIPWLISSVVTEGNTSLRSGAIGGSEASCLVLELETELPAGTVIDFSLRTDSQARLHRLFFAADNRGLIPNFSASGSATVKDWEAQQITLANDVSNKLSWCYLKNTADAAGADAGWLDGLSFTPPLAAAQVCRALDMSADDCALITSVSTTLPTGLTLPNIAGQISMPSAVQWLVSPVASQGDSSMRSGAIDHSKASCLVLAATLPANTRIGFSLRTDSQGQRDRLVFAANTDILIQNFSADSGDTIKDWEQTDVLLSNPVSSLSWCYLKDTADAFGMDAGWLDRLFFIAAPDVPLNRQRVCLVLDMSAEDCALITIYASDPATPPWLISFTIATEGDSSLRSPDIDDDQTSCLVLGVALPDDRTVRFSLRSDSEAVNDFLYFEADGFRLIETFGAATGSSVRDFEQLDVFLTGDIRKLGWCYTKNASTSTGDDSGWLDGLSFGDAGDLATIPLTRGLVCQALDMSTDDCAMIDSVAAAPPERPWVLSDIATEGSLALRSGDIDDDQTSCLVLGISLPADRSIRFSLRTDSEAVNDFLYFAADSTTLVDTFTSPTPGTTLRDWEPLEFLIVDTISNLRWCYTKNADTRSVADSGWLDALSFTVPDVPREQLCTALDMNADNCALITDIASLPPTGLILAQLPVDVPWVISTTATKGDRSLRSGVIDDNQASCLVLEAALPAGTLIRFSPRTNSEGSFDHLTFAADSLTIIGNFSAAENNTLRNWERQEYIATNPVSNLSWCYQKNANTDGASDAGWIDALTFAVPASLSTTQLCTALDLSADNCSQIQSVSADPPFFSWQIATDTSVAGGSSLRSGTIDNSEQSCLVLNLSLPAGTVITLASRSSSQGGFDQLQVIANNLRLDTLSAAISSTERTWGYTTYYLPSAATALRWCYVKDSIDSNGEDSVWIDKLSFSTSNISYQSRICAALDLAEATCSMVTDISYSPPELLWIITSQTSVLGGTSLRSGDIRDDDLACLLLDLPTNTPLPANTVIRFSVRIDSEANDFLLFEATRDNGQVVETFTFNATNSSLRDWEQMNVLISDSISRLGWCYQKNGSTSSGADAAWLDALSFTFPLTTEDICPVLDLGTEECALITAVAFDPPGSPWLITTDTSVAGVSSMRSGAIDDGEQSCLVLNLSLPANSVISLASRTSSQGGFDQLQFATDQQRLDTLSAAIGTTEKPWGHTTWYLPTAATALRWCYVKDSTASSGQDSAWIDKLSFSTSNISYKSRICTALDMTEALCSMVASISYSPLNKLWVITSQTSVLGGTSLRSADIGDGERTCLTPSLSLSPLPANALIRFSVRSDSEAVNDFLLFESSGGNRLIDNFSATNGSLRDWEPQEFRLPNSAPGPAWCYEKNGSSSSGADSVWLDALSVIIPLTTEDVCLALDLSPEECTLITGVAADPPQSLWQLSPIATESSTSLRSADIDDDQQSCLVLNLSPLAGPTVVQFSLRISSQPLADRLLFAADGQSLDYRLRPESDTVLRDWSRQLVIVPAGTTSLSWCYRKDGMTSMGEDSIWIDELSITATTVAVLTSELVCLVLDIDLDGCGIIRSVTFDPPASPWLISSTATEGDFSLRSADIDDSESSCLVLEIALSVDRGIRFSLRTDSEAVNDHLSFAAGAQELIETFAAAEDSTLMDWEAQQFLLPAGDSTLRWCYNKNSSTSSGADSGWLDALSFISVGLVQFEPLCEALDLFQAQCANIRSITYEPPQSLWLTTATESARGGSALVSPALNTGESSCLTVEFYSPLTPDSPVAFDWRTTSQSAQDTLQFRVGAQQSQIESMSEWQTQTVMIDSAETTIGWCYSQNSAADGQTARAWLDNLSLLTLTDRYAVQIAVIPTSLLVTEDSDGFRFQVTVTAVSETLPPPTDWVLVIAGIDNISAADTTYTLVFSGNSAQIDALATSDDPLLPSSILLSLEDRPSLLNTTTGTSLVFQLPAVRRLETLEIITSASVIQSAPDAMLVIAVTVTATDNLGEPFEPAGLTLMVEDAGNAAVSQSNYALSFVDGSATTSFTVGLTRRGDVGSITLSVASGDIQSTASITLNPAPRVLASITLSAASSNLVQTTANTTVAAVLMLAALDNYGDPIEAGDVNLQLEATNAAMVVSSLTVAIATTATVLQTIEILPQNELDTTVTVSILRGTLDESVQLLPDGGIQIAVRVLRVLRQLQLSLVDRVSPLRQVDRSLPIRANIRLIGLDQFGQPSAFSEVMLIITAEPLETTATLNPQQLTATGPEGTQTMLEVTFPGNNPMETMITIAIVGPAAGVTTNSLLVQALPDPRDALQPLNVDAPETGVTELDLIVALRWLTDQQSSTASLVVNLTIPSTSVMTAGIENLRQLFTDPANLDRVDLNGDKRADQLDLRILVRWLSGLRGSALTEQGTSADLEGIIQLLLGSAP